MFKRSKVDIIVGMSINLNVCDKIGSYTIERLARSNEGDFEYILKSNNDENDVIKIKEPIFETILNKAKKKKIVPVIHDYNLADYLEKHKSGISL